MSGYCPDCGNTQCICKDVERQEVDERMVHMPNNSLAAAGFRNITRGAGNNEKED